MSRISRISPKSKLLLTIAGVVVAAVAWKVQRDYGSLEFHSRLLPADATLSEAEAETFRVADDRTAPDLAEPFRLQAGGEPIDIGLLSNIAHAGPTVADVDGDGDRDLLVGDFPGFFWYFQNDGTDEEPRYLAGTQLMAGGAAAKTPVY
ncbi:MAG: hypothetical protein KDA89_22875 [Planctomycetaceae bacterium]|nr:hypothetical protein [Planctomycetaceae bacterium]